MRILGSWVASHPDTAQLVLEPVPDQDRLAAFLAGDLDHDRAERALGEESGLEGELDDDRLDLVGADRDA